MSSERYSETRSFRETNRNNSTDNSRLKFPNDERVNLPIQQTINRFNQSTNEQRLQERLRHQETTLQWVNDPVSGQEKFRINVNIDGFNQNEVNVRVEGNRLHVFGEHLETKDQSTAKKIIEKTYDLPRDIDTYGYQVTFPSVTLMQIDFPSRHSNVIIDDGRLSSRLVTDYDSTLRTSPGITKERTSSEYTSTRKIGGGGGSSTLQNPRSNSLYDNLSNRSTAFSTTNDYQIPVNRDFTNSSAFNNTTTSNYQNPVSRDFTNSSSFNNSTTSNYQIPVNRDFTNSSAFNNLTTNNYQPRSTYPSTSRGENNVVREQTYSETHRETEHRRSSPTSGVQTSREVEHHRSGSPSLGRTLDENRFRTTLNLGNSTSISPSSSSRNIEVREFSRRVGSNGGVGTETNLNLEPIRFSSSFNSDAFYRSAFQPQIFTDNSGQQRIEMKLDVSNYQPSEIKVAIEGEDLVVRAEHSVDRPPTTSSRNFFFKQITLPPNTDFKSLASKHYPDGTLHITAKLN